ncbi:MAG: hypothetical protein GF421_10730 [Candidatus Aminicenantes bacterium]|nr:hypothetical protein [Candidatus Aminicenantes bacterium]
MKRFANVLFFLFVLLLLLITSCSKTEVGAVKQPYPADVDEYEFLRFSGGQEIVSPDQVVRADNNWEILLSCLESKTRNELRDMNVDFTESQLMLLQAMRFVDCRDEFIQTTLPILSPEQKQKLIPYLRQLAQDIDPVLREDIHKLKIILTDQGYPGHVYSVLFSCVVDGLVWFPFRAQGLISEFSLSEERPLFDGVYWAYSPKRNFRGGSNIAIGKDTMVVLNWSDGPQEKIQKIFHWDNLYSMQEQLDQHGKIVDQDLLDRLLSYEVVDPQGRMIVPVIEMKSDDPVFLLCQSTAAKIVGFMNQNLDLEALQKDFNFPDKESAFVVAYHEWMWEFMEYVTERGLIDKPLAFEQPDQAGKKDIGKLLFVIKGSISNL